MAVAEVFDFEEAWGAEPPLSEVSLPADPFELLALGHAVIDRLNEADLSALSDVGARNHAREVSELSARVGALEVDATGAIDERGHDQSLGFGTTRSWIRHHRKLSGPTALARTQTMRMFALLPTWAQAARAGGVGTDQTVLMGRVASNPRIQLDLVANVERLLADARRLPYDQFERRLRNFERSADGERARRDAEAVRERRDASMRLRPDGSWRLTATFGSLDGAEVNEVFAHFIDAEWKSDLATSGDAPLSRCEAQRRADAVLAMARAAARAPGRGKAPLPTLDVLVDHRTLHATTTGEQLDPGRYDEMICRTQAGDPVDVTEAAALSLWGHIRRVVHDGRGTVIDLGRRRRLFTGSARDAALLLSMTCLWPGCERPSRNVEVDHSVEWSKLGPTGPSNAGPMCKGHNLLKDRGGFRTHRRSTGDWIVTDPDGNPVG
jgi:hypothetical protein